MGLFGPKCAKTRRKVSGYEEDRILPHACRRTLRTGVRVQRVRTQHKAAVQAKDWTFYAAPTLTLPAALVGQEKVYFAFRFE